MRIKEIIHKIKELFRYEAESVETAYYDETLNQYGSKHATKGRVTKYVKELKKERDNDK